MLFAAQCGQKLDPNALALRLQPDEGISLRFNGKVPGTSVAVRPVRMHFSYDAEFGAYTPEAYERLLLEAMAGDATLFIRRDEVETAWQDRGCDSPGLGWEATVATGSSTPPGTWGPVAADELLAQSGHAWREPVVVKSSGGNAARSQRRPSTSGLRRRGQASQKVGVFGTIKII